jgi:hypothetical protein
MELISRKEAKRLGLKRYYTGKQCSNGHICERYVRGECIDCQSQKSKDNGPKEHYKKLKKDWKIKNKEYHDNQSKIWYENNKDRRLAASKNWRESNRGLVTSYTRKYQTGKENRTPSYANQEKMKDFYKNCPPGSEVDHIIPLHGKLVSGFHIETNLQYLTVSENCSKSNKYNPSQLACASKL